jgi:hypothetical protein
MRCMGASYEMRCIPLYINSYYIGIRKLRRSHGGATMQRMETSPKVPAF